MGFEAPLKKERRRCWVVLREFNWGRMPAEVHAAVCAMAIALLVNIITLTASIRGNWILVAVSLSLVACACTIAAAARKAHVEKQRTAIKGSSLRRDEAHDKMKKLYEMNQWPMNGLLAGTCLAFLLAVAAVLVAGGRAVQAGRVEGTMQEQRSAVTEESVQVRSLLRELKQCIEELRRERLHRNNRTLEKEEPGTPDGVAGPATPQDVSGSSEEDEE